jgi:hypothetical protein
MATATPPPVPPAPYKHQEYPTWRYSAAGILYVKTAAADAALGDGWYESPADVPKPKAKAKAEDAAPSGGADPVAPTKKKKSE